MKEVRPEDAGCDADAVFEALWEYQDEAEYKIVGGELIFPRLMGERLREIRAAVAAESKQTLMELVAPELRKARLEYTDYVEEDDDGLGTYGRFKLAADVEGERETYSHKDIIAEVRKARSFVPLTYVYSISNVVMNAPLSLSRRKMGMGG